MAQLARGKPMSEREARKKELKKSVKRLAKKAWERADYIQTVQGEVLKNAPYVAGNVGLAMQVSFLSSYGFARIKGQVRVKKALIEEREKLKDDLLDSLHKKSSS